MITSLILKETATYLNTRFKVDVLGEDAVFPDKGDTFIRLYGTSTELTRREQVVEFDVTLGVTTVVRTRTFNIQNRDTPYYRLLDLSEKIVFGFLTDDTVLRKIKENHPTSSQFGLMLPSIVSTEPMEVSPSYFGSKDYSSERAAGYKMDISITFPTIHIPITCNTLPASLIYA